MALTIPSPTITGLAKQDIPGNTILSNLAQISSYTESTFVHKIGDDEEIQGNKIFTNTNNVAPIIYLKSPNASYNTIPMIIGITDNATNNGIRLLTGANNFDGASLQIFGRDCTTTTNDKQTDYSGQFYLRASTKTTATDTEGKSVELIGKPDGTLTWGGQNIVRVIKTTRPTTPTTPSYGDQITDASGIVTLPLPYVEKTGDTISGNLTVSGQLIIDDSGNGYIHATDDSLKLRMYANNYNKGASFELYSADQSINPDTAEAVGQFIIRALSSTNDDAAPSVNGIQPSCISSGILVGRPDGRLTWDREYRTYNSSTNSYSTTANIYNIPLTIDGTEANDNGDVPLNLPNTYVPLSGSGWNNATSANTKYIDGSLTIAGNIKCRNINNYSDVEAININAGGYNLRPGTDAFPYGPQLALYPIKHGANNSSTRGDWTITTGCSAAVSASLNAETSAVERFTLRGKPSGSLTWGNVGGIQYNLVRTIDGVTANVSGDVSLSNVYFPLSGNKVITGNVNIERGNHLYFRDSNSGTTNAVIYEESLASTLSCDFVIGRGANDEIASPCLRLVNRAGNTRPGSFQLRASTTHDDSIYLIGHSLNDRNGANAGKLLWGNNEVVAINSKTSDSNTNTSTSVTSNRYSRVYRDGLIENWGKTSIHEHARDKGDGAGSETITFKTQYTNANSISVNATMIRSPDADFEGVTTLYIVDVTTTGFTYVVDTTNADNQSAALSCGIMFNAIGY